MQVTITANAIKSMLPGFAMVLSSRNHIPELDCACIEKAASEFPELFQDKPKFAPCNVGQFLSAYRTALCAATRDESRRALHSVFADTAEAALVATDGRRMMKPGLQPFPLTRSLLVPQTTKALATGILGAVEGFIGAGHAGSSDTLDIRAAPWRYQVRCSDPIQDLPADLNAAQDTALDTLNRLKAVRQKARNVERHYRSKAKEIAASAGSSPSSRRP